MNARSVHSATDAAAFVEARNISHIKLGIVDLDGVLRGKYVSKAKFFSALENGLGFCDVVLGWDVEDRCYDNVGLTGWHTGFPDAQVRIIPESCRSIPFEPGTAFFLCEFADPTSAICPRGVLGRVLAQASKQGLKAFAAFEYEFFMFEETPHSVREKGYRNLRPWTPGSFGYSVLRSSTESDFYHLLMTTCEQMDIPLEGLHTETGPGVLEACITVDEGIAVADKAALFKTFSKALAQRNGLMATFMAKWSEEEAGQGGHIHISLKNESGVPVFFDATKSHSMSDTMRHFIGGQQALMPELMAMVGSTVNSYSRLVPGLWAPTSANWAVDNRTTALRAIHGSAKSQRVEYRVAAADANPYLALAAALASGLWGIENRVEPDAPIVGNAYDSSLQASRRLPSTLWEAAQWLKGSSIAREMFGDAFVDHYAASREWEERQFRKHVTDWELARYLEII